MNSGPGDARLAPSPAGRGARLAATAIDGLLQAALLCGLYFAMSDDPTTDAQTDSLFELSGLLMLIALAVFGITQSTLLAKRGQTIGKKLLGLRILRSNGERAGLGRLLGLRYGVGLLIELVPVIGMIYALVDLLLIFREPRRCVHDYIADTIVVRA